MPKPHTKTLLAEVSPRPSKPPRSQKGDCDNCVIACFSGGRSSAVMVTKMIAALKNGGELPHHKTGKPAKICDRLDAVVFSNTGLETKETLDFVWGVAENIIKPAGIPFYPIEFALRPAPPKEDGTPNFPIRTWREVKSRNDFSPVGEPWMSHIKVTNNVPNKTRRKCTMILKVETTARFVNDVFNTRFFSSALGLRADEPLRTASQEERNWSLDEVVAAGRTPKMGESYKIFPLEELGIDTKGVKAEIARWGAWANIAKGETRLSNCVGCFYERGGIKHKAMAFQRHPKHAAIWLQTEEYVQAVKAQDNRKERYSSPKDMMATHALLFNAKLPERMKKRFTAHPHFCWEQAKMLADKGFDASTLGFTYGEGGGCGGHCNTDL